MSSMCITVRVEIEDARGQITTIERTVIPRAFGDNPIFFGDVAEQGVAAAQAEIREAIDAVHGTAPHRALVQLV